MTGEGRVRPVVIVANRRPPADGGTYIRADTRTSAYRPRADRREWRENDHLRERAQTALRNQ